MRLLPVVFTAGTLALSASISSASTLIFEETLNPLNGRGSPIFFDGDDDFDVTFDFSSVNFGTIDRIEVTLDTEGSLDEGLFPAFEFWALRALGSIDSGPEAAFDDAFRFITADSQTFVFEPGTDGSVNTFLGATTTAVDTFAHTVATGQLSLFLSEFSSDAAVVSPSIQVNSATIRVIGTLVPVPLPAGMPLLLIGLGAFAAVRRRAR